MATFEIQSPDGKTFEVDAPDGATPDQIKQKLSDSGLMKQPSSDWRQMTSKIARPVLEGTGAVGGAVVGSGLGPVGTVAGGALGFGTGKSASDLLDRIIGQKKLIQNIPQALSETGQNIYQGAQNEAMGLAIPAAYGAVKAGASGIGRQMEQLSGLAPRAEGVLSRAANDATLMGAPGRKTVQESYQMAKSGAPVSSELTSQLTKSDFINKASQLADSKELNPTSALEARKELDRLRNSMPDATYQVMRQKFDSIAKTLFGNSDAAYKRAIDAEALRNLLPQNKYGGASAFKLGIIAALRHSPVVGTMMSPAVQGTVATGVGLANRYALDPIASDPQASRAAAALLLNAIKSNQKRTTQ